MLVKTIMLSAPACFILPICWSEYEGAIKSCLDTEESRLHSSFDSISKRNERLGNRSLNQKTQATPSHRQTIIVYLDSLCEDQSFRKVASACLRVTSDYDLLVRTCIEWSSSVYRHGRFRAYAAARLLRIWKGKGVDLQRPIFDFLAASSDVPGLQKKTLYKLLAELVRSRHLSVGKYLQWLIARGTLHGEHGSDSVSTRIFRGIISPADRCRMVPAMSTCSLSCLCRTCHLTFSIYEACS